MPEPQTPPAQPPAAPPPVGGEPPAAPPATPPPAGGDRSLEGLTAETQAYIRSLREEAKQNREAKQALEREKAEREAAEREAAETALAEQNRFKELADQRAAQIATLQAERDRFKTDADAFTSYLQTEFDSVKAQLGEAADGLPMEGMDLQSKLKLAKWALEQRAAQNGGTPPAPSTPPNGRNGPAPRGTGKNKTELTDEILKDPTLTQAQKAEKLRELSRT